MMPYPSGLILDNSNNYGIVKTETVFGFVPPNHTFVNENINDTEPVEWVFKPGSFERRSLQGSSRALATSAEKTKNKTQRSKKSKKHKRKSKGKINKCIYKVIKQPKRKDRRRNKFKMPKKMMMPLILGLLAAKSILIPVALKALAFMSVKARGKIKKYAPLLTGIGVKVIAVLGLLFGGLTLLVTKALVVAKLAFLAAAALGIQKLLSGGGLNNISGKIASFQSPSPQWNSPTAPASSYPYARSSNVAQDGNDLAYKSQIPS
ncbi:hypothetical protein MSG28_014242 [Choristoneura fumiferana]|uniref:Uncharacterized protein n=1 Tax=Choristoneura fumiferana TaxID=7141 RepID=A0ACC0JGI8_CHOFU|nr:hypothetical protein MSG28_014242 [Choristoneura fumiferana]